jgi:hypothetical protein
VANFSLTGAAVQSTQVTASNQLQPQFQNYVIMPLSQPVGTTWTLDPAINKTLMAMGRAETLIVDNRNGCLDFVATDAAGQLFIVCLAGTYGVYSLTTSQPILTITYVTDNSNNGAGWTMPASTASDPPVTYLTLLNYYVEPYEFRNLKKNFHIRGGYVSGVTSLPTNLSNVLIAAGQYNTIECDVSASGTAAFAGRMFLTNTTQTYTIGSFPFTCTGAGPTSNVHFLSEIRGYMGAGDTLQLSSSPAIPAGMSLNFSCLFTFR